MFGPSIKLSTLASTVGMLSHHSSQRKTWKGVGSDQTSREVAKILMSKWYHNTLPYIKCKLKLVDTYSIEVLRAVTSVTEEHKTEAGKLAGLMRH